VISSAHEITARPSRLALGTWFVGLFTLVIARSVSSIHHLPPDPALGFQSAVQSRSIWSAFSLEDGYLQVTPRLLSELLNVAPLSQLTYWATFIHAVLVAISGLFPESVFARFQAGK